jgi:hypothetical protein
MKTLTLASLVIALVMVGRAVAAEPGPDDMVGRWTGVLTDGPKKGEPAADLEIALSASGPDIHLVLYRYAAEGEGKPEVQRLPVVRHEVKGGVLSFHTREEDFRLKKDDLPSSMEADWEFAVLGAEKGELRLIALKAQGENVPPVKAPPLAMKRAAKQP